MHFKISGAVNSGDPTRLCMILSLGRYLDVSNPERTISGFSRISRLVVGFCWIDVFWLGEELDVEEFDRGRSDFVKFDFVLKYILSGPTSR